MIKAIVFDMDGVLIDAKDWHYLALNRALRLFGFEIHRYDHLTVYDGLPTRKKLEMLSIEKGLPVALHALINEMKQIYTMEMVHTQCKPKFIHEYALSQLKLAGYQLAVASNSIRHTVEVMLKKACLFQYLDVILSNEDVQCAKPDPEIYVRSMQMLGLSPKECLIVEDNPVGIRAAVAAGAHVMAVQTVEDVTLENIRKHLRSIDGAGVPHVIREQVSVS